MLIADATALLLEKALSQGFSVGLLVAGIYAVGKMMLKNQERANAVQDERIADLKDRIKVLEAKVDDCEADREALWGKLARIDPTTTVPPPRGVSSNPTGGRE